MRAEPSLPNHLLEAPPLSTATLGRRFQHELWRDKHSNCSNVLSPEPVTAALYGESNFGDVFKFKLLRWGGCPGLSIRPDAFPEILPRGRQIRKVIEGVMMEQEAGMMCHKPRHAGHLYNLGKALQIGKGETNFPHDPPEGV